jgi:hypothetical protein
MIKFVILKARQFASTPPHVAYCRDILRPRILRAPPTTNTHDELCEIHVLTSAKDWLNLMWTLKSFYHFCPRRFALCVHGDASLPPEAVSAFRSHFPDARVIEQSEAREAVLDGLASHPRCRTLREKNTLSIKLFDFRHYLSSERMALFDSDLLFFAEPSAWLAYAEDPARRVNVFNRDLSTAYAVDMDVIQAHGVDVRPEVNSGFGLVHKESLSLDWIEEFLAIPGLADGHFWRIEQTLFALCSSRFGVELLPDDYRVFLEGPLGDRPYRHYVGAVRNKMYTEGMRKLAPTLLGGAMRQEPSRRPAGRSSARSA